MNMPAKIDAAAARRELLAKMLAGDAARASAAPAPIPVRPPEARIPLTAEQNQLWLHAQMAPEMPLYNESITIHRWGPYDHQALEKALTEVVRRHAVWRSAIVEVGGDYVMEVAPSEHISLRIIDISHLPEGERDAEAVRLATEDAREPIPADRAPLFRARVVRMGEEDHRLYLTLHHVIFDGVSIYKTLVPELSKLVDAYEQGLPSPLPEPTLQYADYAVWQAGLETEQAYKPQLAFWREQLVEPIPRLEIVGDRPRAALPTYAGSMHVFEIEAHLTERLKEIARAENATLYAVLLAGYKAMLYRYTGDEDVIVGGVTDTRRRPELQPLMGYFLNTFAIRSRPAGKTVFRDYLAQVKRSVIGALGASDIPFDKMLRALDIKRGTGTHPLFNTLFSIEPPVDPFPAGWDLTQMDVTVGAAKYDLYLELDERPEGGMHARFLYSTELYDAVTIERMADHWLRLLDGVAADPATPLAALPMVDPAERAQENGWNETRRDIPYDSVVEWVAQRAASEPTTQVIAQDGTVWTYADLAQRSDAIAYQLNARGVGPGQLVGLSVERTPWMIAAMLGIAKTGAAYLPLDPGFPPARLATIVESAEPALILCEPSTEHVLPQNAAPLLHLARDWPAQAFTPPALDPEAPVYVLYTSGSTGKPKGVEIPHAALTNFLVGMEDSLGVAPRSSILAITTLSFDIAELEIWLPLVTGGKVHLATRETATDMIALAEMVERLKPSILQATPATWRGLIEAGWQGAPAMKALCGGEKMPRTLADQLRPRVAELWNMYGPTETTIWSTVARVLPEGTITIGKPIANTTIRILDEHDNDRPLGAVGELCIGGRGVAIGYRGRPDLTEAKFVTVAGERLYRTGDLARWRPDGMLECLGRTDNEEKIRGFRVAIEEVEGALAALPGVSAAVVKAWPDASGERALCGYLVGTGEIAEWREQLSATLPDYMIPTRFVVLPELPQTPNGKVDRHALPEPGAPVVGTIVPLEGAAEEKLAKIWSEVLKTEVVSRNADFFDLGGHSLLIARLLRRIDAEYKIKLPMAALFQAPRLADMAAVIASGKVDNPAVAPIQPHGSQPPIIWLDGGSTFRPLADRLGDDQPFLGVSTAAVIEAQGPLPPKDFRDTAKLIVKTLKQVQPEGPYRIGGWCTAGILAYAVASEMEAQGEEVRLLMLAHPFHPVAARQIGAVRFFLSKFKYHLDKTFAQPKGKRLRYFLDRLQGLSDAAALAGGREAVLQPKMQSALDHSASRYTPPVYQGDVILFQPDDHPGVLDFVKEWRAQVHGEFEAHIVPGGHRTMLEAPHVDVLAGLLQARLAKVNAAAARRAA
ncbi:non-ribosomal peptide synthetase [Sphingomonas immobilis]|uniref:Amino acid adenylation domain-containing protein n=1 Tax=Sphingomonas immobilis TaxID=3063997 RepID=A0ABT9A2T0_9SPHN|nr:amino acid adenylation domain-containing protein [Sphingomonas sp. CA1-15]MDO7843037.1 amino acid adenylation domain-containing protein [Sphingomonas sp. CA1-15]